MSKAWSFTSKLFLALCSGLSRVIYGGGVWSFLAQSRNPWGRGDRGEQDIPGIWTFSRVTGIAGLLVGEMGTCFAGEAGANL